MIRKIQIVFALSMGVIAGVMLAQTEADFSGWMKGVAAANKGVKGAVAAKDAATLTAAAKTFQDSFKAVETFFTKKGGAADAVGWAKANQEAAAAMGAAATAGNFEAAGTSAGVIGASCNTCHAAHREGAKGGPYTIK